MKLHTAMPKPYAMDMKMNVDSEAYFNEPKKMADLKAMGMEPCPVDVFGAYVPTDKNSDLKKTEQSIRDRFGLNVGGDE